MKITDVRFADLKIRKAYQKLEQGATEERELFKKINKVIQILKKNPETGIRIRKKLIPYMYIKKFSVSNLWKCNLGKKWRLLYTIAQDEVRIVSIILEWLNHKHYERRFSYS
jgi:Txe/YoeB family toxin of Txe-Axe toxin-antitoxin module